MHAARTTVSGLLLVLATAGATSRAQEVAAQAKDAPDRPNVVLVVADDLTARLGCYGDAYAVTPHIDRLAREGARFDRAYCQAALCRPSRTSLLTGVRPAGSGIFQRKDPQDLDLVTLPEHFARHGYHTARVGKVLHPTRRQDRWRGVRGAGQARGTPVEKHSYWSEILPLVDAPSRGAEPPLRATDHVFAGDQPIHFGRVGRSLDDSVDGRIAEAAARFLRTERGKPFLLAVGFSKPHLPMHAPASAYEPYALEEAPLPALPAGTAPQLAPRDWRRVVQAYYACATNVDAGVGRLLDALEESGQADRTIVLVTSDHGQLLGEHNRWLKDVLLEDCVRVPLVVRDPRRPAAAASSALVELVDVFPTLAELCGLPVPKTCQGTSFAPLLADPTRPWKRAAFTYDPEGTSMRTDRWRYTRWSSGERELYDHASDPFEHANLAPSEAHAEVLRALDQELEGGWRAALPR